MTVQNQLSQPSPAEPELPPARETWTKLFVGIAVLLVVLFFAVRIGAEHGNQVRFGFPDKVDGIRVVQPDRAPEARGRDLYVRYNSASDDVASLVVEWLPETAPEEVTFDGIRPAARGSYACRVLGDDAVCLTTFKDGVIRVSQKRASLDEITERAGSFLKGIKLPD